MQDQEMIPILRTLCYLAWADSKVQPQERGYILDLADQLEVQPEVRSQVMQWLETPPELGHLAAELHSREDRKFLLMQLKVLCKVDGFACPEEMLLIANVIEELQLTADEVAEVDMAIDPVQVALVVQELVSRIGGE